MSNSASNNLPFVPENTIDPAAGLNLTIADLDIVLNISCLGFYDAPPSGLTDGDRLIVGTGSGDFAGYDNYIAQYISEGDLFRFIAPTEGMRATIKEDGGYDVEFYEGAWRVSQGIRSQGYLHNFTADSDEIATDLPPDCPMIVVTDSGTVLTGTRTLTLPNTRLAPIIGVFNATSESIMIKGHGDIGPGVTVEAALGSTSGFLWVNNYGPFIGQPMYLASMSRSEFLGGIASLEPGQKVIARTGLDVYSKAEVDALIASHVSTYHP